MPKLEQGHGDLTLPKDQTSWIGIFFFFYSEHYYRNILQSIHSLIYLFIYFFHHEASIIVLSVPVGCLISAILMEWIGRLNTVKLAAIPCVIGWVMIASASNFIELLIGRILTG